MPRFFFDFHDGETLDRDDTGTEVGTLDEAEWQVMTMLARMAAEEVGAKHFAHAISIRDEAGQRRAAVTIEPDRVPDVKAAQVEPAPSPGRTLRSSTTGTRKHIGPSGVTGTTGNFVGRKSN
jgi:hypothetical protein